MSQEQKHKNGQDEQSLLGTLAATVIFVGGGIFLCMLLLFIVYMIRV